MISHFSNSFHKITRDKLEHGIIMVFDLWMGSTGKGVAAGGGGRDDGWRDGEGKRKKTLFRMLCLIHLVVTNRSNHFFSKKDNFQIQEC